MQDDVITFQLATHYLPKIALRLEYLSQTIEMASKEIHPIIHHSALKNLLEILQLTEKPELKSRFLKELMRIEHLLHKPNYTFSSDLLKKLHLQIQLLTQTAGRFGENIHQDPFLLSIKNSQVTIKDCEMTPPQLLVWLESNPYFRQSNLLVWLTTLRTLSSTVELYLALLRTTADFKKIDMNHGFYQRALPAANSCHLILLQLDKTLGIVPKMQLGHHGLSIRLYEITTMQEVQSKQITPDLAICQL